MSFHKNMMQTQELKMFIINKNAINTNVFIQKVVQTHKQ